jgi:hypothetical protein
MSLNSSTMFTGKLQLVLYNPLHGLNTEEYKEASHKQKELYVKSACREAEKVIFTLHKMFPGDISNLIIQELNLSVRCILKIHRNLTSNEYHNIRSISRYIEIIG